MHPPTTLRGIFPERKVNHRKNFIRENMRKLKQLQEVTSQHQQQTQQLTPVETDKSFTRRSGTPKVSSKVNIDSKQQVRDVRKPGITKLEMKPIKKVEKPQSPNVNDKDDRIVHRAMQTEPSDNINLIYATGTIKYASSSVLYSPTKLKKDKKKPEVGHGDAANIVCEEKTQSDKDYVKQNKVLKVRNLNTKREFAVDPTKAPPNYRKGVLPKYIKQKKDIVNGDDGDVECPLGHVLLPEEERKETLRVLRESYADKIQELNSMPVRSDTLRMQRRKMDLEEELKKIDEGIKVFQRPKVFVKINV